MAWTRLLLPQANTSYYGHDPHSAVFILHVYPRTRDGSPAPPANLADWHDRLVRGLAIPSALASFLTQDLGLATIGDKPAQAGIYLDAPHSMTELVDTEDLKSLPGSSMPSWFMGWAVSDPDGQQTPALARDWLAQMCDNTLFLDGYEPVLEALTNPHKTAATPTALKADQTPAVQNIKPISAEIAVQRLKEALPNPARRIELSDLIDHEIQQLASRITDTTRHPLGGIPFAVQRTAYEEETATSALLLATGVFHSDETHIHLWIRSLRRLMSARRPITGSFNSATEAMRHYPALLCLWAMGLSAILADHENLLARILLEPTWIPIFGEPRPQAAVHCLNPNRIVVADEPAPTGHRWVYPQSHHIRAASRQTLAQIEPDDDMYKKACNRLEYLASLVAMDNTDAPTQVPWIGEFVLVDSYLDQDPNPAKLLKGGAFGGDPKRARVARDALVAWINQYGRRW